MFAVDTCADYSESEYVFGAGTGTCQDAAGSVGKCPVCGKENPAYTKPGTAGKHSFTKYIQDKYDVVRYVAECDYGCGATIDSNAPVVNKVVFDFEKANSNYGAYTSASGWVIANGCVQAGGTSDSNPYFKAIGADNTTQAVCLNGKNSAIGKLTSPTLTGGISKLTFNYGIMFSDSKVGVTIKITDANGVSQTTTLSDTTMTKFAVETFTWTLETAVTGSFTIEITNTCPSNSTSNKDRISIWNIQYEG
jgi:hypothetical protein